MTLHEKIQWLRGHSQTMPKDNFRRHLLDVCDAAENQIANVGKKMDSAEMVEAVAIAITEAHGRYLNGGHDFDDISRNHGFAKAALAAVKQHLEGK